MSSSQGLQNRIMVSHLTLRRIVGILGVTLPIVLPIGCWALGDSSWYRDSISDYYDSDMRNILVGVLFSTGFFLFVYRGYERRDNLAGDLACLGALGVALFPVTSTSDVTKGVHYISAFVLFSTLAYFSLCLFTETGQGSRLTKKKQTRNRVYRTCGWTIVICILTICIYKIGLHKTFLAELRPVFWLESGLLVAFGTSWFVKGATLWRDAENDNDPTNADQDLAVANNADGVTGVSGIGLKSCLRKFVTFVRSPIYTAVLRVIEPVGFVLVIIGLGLSGIGFLRTTNAIHEDRLTREAELLVMFLDEVEEARQRGEGQSKPERHLGLVRTCEKIVELGISLGGADLRSISLEEADLTDAILKDADLTDAILANADLTDAILANATLDSANLILANLVRADLTDAELNCVPDSDRADAQSNCASLKQADLTHAYLTNAELKGADLSGAIFDRTDITGTDLTDVKNLESFQLGTACISDSSLPPTLPNDYEWTETICSEP